MKTPKEIMSEKIMEAVTEFNNLTGACPSIIRIRVVDEKNVSGHTRRLIPVLIEFEME